jgi:hypothetical protein
MLEKAIKHFEALQKRYTSSHNGKMCEYVKIALDAMYKELNHHQKAEIERLLTENHSLAIVQVAK